MIGTAVAAIGIALLPLAPLATPARAAALADMKRFIAFAREDNAFCMAMGDLAYRRAQNERFRNLGVVVRTDCGSANSDVGMLARDKNAGVVDKFDDEKKQLLDRLAHAPATDFEQQFLKAFISNRREMLSAYQRQGGMGHDAVSNYAAKAARMLQKQLKTATDLTKPG